MPKVSVMFMSYNHAPYIIEAMNSVLQQTYTDFEVVLSDDCSTDNTKEVLSSVTDARVKLHFFEKNQGATINNLYLKDNCSGEYLALINSDDVWAPEHLQKSVEYLDAHPECGVVFSWADLIDENSKVIDPCCEVFRQPNRTQGEWAKWLFTKGNCLCHPSMVIRRTVYEQAGFYKIGFRQLPDFNMWTRAINYCNFHVIPEILVHHRRCIVTGQNTSAPVLNNSVRDVNESFYTLLHYFDNMPDSLFIEAFQDEFRNKDAKTTEELKCEKFFLMYDGKYYMSPISKFAAFLYLQSIYEDTWQLMGEKYGFSLKDVHDLGSEWDLAGLRKPVASAPVQNVINAGKRRFFFRKDKV